jgi:hypothetical protein
MINEKLAQHISNEFWLQKSKVVEVLGKFEETPQRDYTGVKFHCVKGMPPEVFHKLIRDNSQYVSGNGNYYTQEQVESFFQNGTWIELPQEEQPTIHTSKPSDIEERVKSLEAAILPTKRNLDIDTTPEDWKKVECLSWEDVIEILSSGLSIENYIKNKLKK